MQENQQLQERVKATLGPEAFSKVYRPRDGERWLHQPGSEVLDDENTGLKHTMARQKEEILAPTAQIFAAPFRADGCFIEVARTQ